MGVIGDVGDVGNDFKVVPAGTQGLHGEIMGGADVISLVVGDGCGAVVVGHVVSVVVVIVGVRVSKQGRQGAGRHGDSKRELGQVEPAPVQAVCILLLLPQITYSMRCHRWLHT